MRPSMRTSALGQSGPVVPVLGLGCSHIASLSTRPSGPEIARLLAQAYDGGIRFFDTADIYGQGDSERRLAPMAARDGVAICTKAGLALSASQSLVRLVKPVLRPVLHSLKGAQSRAAEMRQKAEISDLDPARLTKRFEASLRRLRRDRVEVFLLHSPPLDALADGALYDLLDSFRDRGLVGATGVSCRSLEDAGQIIATGRVQAVELPLDADCLEAAAPVLRAAQTAGVGIIAREVLRPRARLGLDGALRPLLDAPEVNVVLTGTTNPAHLAKTSGSRRAGTADASQGASDPRRRDPDL